jgi:hypothetical protein
VRVDLARQAVGGDRLGGLGALGGDARLCVGEQPPCSLQRADSRRWSVPQPAGLAQRPPLRVLAPQVSGMGEEIRLRGHVAPYPQGW